MFARLAAVSTLALLPSLAFAQSDEAPGAPAPPPIPILEWIGEKVVQAGNPLSFEVYCWDNWGGPLTLNAGPLPQGASFNDLEMGYGQFDWTPSVDQVGGYAITFRCSNDLGFEDATELVPIQVVLDAQSVFLRRPIGPFSVATNDLLSFPVTCGTTGPGGPLQLSMQALPQGASFVDQGGGFANFSWRPTTDQLGSHDVEVICSDLSSGLSDAELVHIGVTLGAVNQPPVLAPIPVIGGEVGETVTFTASAFDPDGDVLIFSLEVAPGSAVIDVQTGRFSWTPNAAGDYVATVVVSDTGVPSLWDSQVVTIRVAECRDCIPVINPVAPQQATEGEYFELQVAASHPNGLSVTISAIGLPVGATFDNNTLAWTPSRDQIGAHSVQFVGLDSEGRASRPVTAQIKVAARGDLGGDLDLVADQGCGCSASKVSSPEASSVLLLALLFMLRRRRRRADRA